MSARMTNMLAVAIAAGAIMAGCGGSSDSSTSISSSASGGSEAPVTTSSLSKSAFVKQASAACERERKNLVKDVNKYFQKNAGKLPEEVLIANIGKKVMAPTIEAEIAAVRKLGAPAGDEEEIAAILAAQQKGVDEVKALKKAKHLEQIESHFLVASKKYRAYGFTACTNSP